MVERIGRSFCFDRLLILFFCFCSLSAGQLGPCSSRPPGCLLNCPFGYTWALGNQCLCFCQPNPCLNRICPLGEICDAQNGVARCLRPAMAEGPLVRPSIGPAVRSSTPTDVQLTVGECPRLVGGSCVSECHTDADCESDRKCCSNGCGHECVQTVNVAPIQSSLPIQSIEGRTANNRISPSPINGIIGNRDSSSGATKIKNGNCPASHLLRGMADCTMECRSDAECPGAHRCCPTVCGRVCSAPEKASVCVHLLSAVQRLPEQRLLFGFVPICTASGSFAPVQCDRKFCWCVNVENGHEILGTKLPVAERSHIQCQAERECEISAQECEAKRHHCPFGLRTDSRGCPMTNCECKNLCEGVSCGRKFVECQLIEPDCAEPPCQPIPKCILNPCPNGPPSTLANGVTALCTDNDPCFRGFWCHQIGYNGLGFCCPGPESAVRNNADQCEAKPPRERPDCESECRVDSDCPQMGKCCFDGCALKCHTNGQIDEQKSERQNKKTKLSIFAENKALLSATEAECPQQTFVPTANGREVCENECDTDNDCRGMRRCCRSGCSRTCQYPQKASACLHVAVTFDVFALGEPPRCSPDGFHEIQCDSERCYCSEPSRGAPIPGTLVPAGQKPNCERIRDCPRLSCPQRCEHGNLFDENGCPLCQCKNPCNDIRCPNDFLCVMVPIDCSGKGPCPQQPRCLPNVCQSRPAINSFNLTIQCEKQCPPGFGCSRVGFPGAGGLCCPLAITGGVGSRPSTHPGDCPFAPLRFLTTALSPRNCRIQCRLDSECSVGEKCCYDGCGMMCKAVATAKAISAAPRLPPNSENKVGECSLLHVLQRRDCRSGVDECASDSDCHGIRKCCSDGCFKRCVFAQRTTACLHLKAAMETLKGREVKCTQSGDFEEIQCDSDWCWCVSRFGFEVDGTRLVADPNALPDCRRQRQCAEIECASTLRCPHGYRKDQRGCSICECATPCDSLQCPSEDSVCTPMDVDCLVNDCPQMPKCIPNVCPPPTAALAAGTLASPQRPLIRKPSNTVATCESTADCPSASHCRLFGWTYGYCCPGAEREPRRSQCPKPPPYPIVGSSCAVKCRADAECTRSGESCCYNGCGMECMQAASRHPGFVAINTDGSSSSAISSSSAVAAIESGCPAHIQDLGNSVCGKQRENLCSSDNDCSPSLKCCFDGCVRSCVAPSKATDCIHLRAAVELLRRLGNPNVFQPHCTAAGTFARIQRFDEIEFCVDRRGREVPGTRSTAGNAQCDRPRQCPTQMCQQNCEFGFEIDGDGCERCLCRDPCHTINCPHDHVCRMVPPMSCDDSVAECDSVPKCVLNACLRGEPLSKPGTSHMVLCNDQNRQKCPPGWFCHRFGMESFGYCCAGLVPDSQLAAGVKCPATPILSDRNGDIHRQRKLECRLSSECSPAEEVPCCFNGYGTSCIRPKGTTPISPVEREDPKVDNPLQSLTPIKPVSTNSQPASCPENRFHNPGCRVECSSDQECSSTFKKCCGYGCGRKCVYPEVATVCVHRLAIAEEESQKVASREANDTVQCVAGGLFRRIQCNSKNECWCVNTMDGKEVTGTRSRDGEPNCLAPRQCSQQCPQHEAECEHGVRLDSDGCPVDGKCECRNPCEDFRCSQQSEICVLRAVQCPQNSPCPKQPTCRPSPCPSRSLIVRTKLGIASTCRRDSECPVSGGECRALATTSDELGHKVGICCEEKPTVSQPLRPMTSNAQKLGICPLKIIDQHESHCQKKCSADSDCLGASKCCTYGCSSSCERPAPSTNCMHMVVALEKLRIDAVSVRIPSPSCDSDLGNYVGAQCDENGLCWCADRMTGAEIVGSRHSQPTFDVCETERKNCEVECREDLTVACPFGLELDPNGCPRTSQCRCRNPCDSIECQNGEICLLRSRDCSEEICLPVPMCEPNPCPTKESPAMEARGFSQFACFHNFSRPCPNNYDCVGFDSRQIGVCCPPLRRSFTESSLDAVAASGRVLCPHGGPFAPHPDASPTICSTITTQNSCPSTHYCVTAPGDSNGHCCPTKRFVCNLELEVGACNRPMSRFHFDSDSKQCEPFVYSGCEGNLNNFESEASCRQFCMGAAVPESGMFGDDPADGAIPHIFNVGFSLTGPLLRQKHSNDFSERLHDYVLSNFALSESEVRDFYVKDDNTVRFNIVASDAQKKATNITEAISGGRFSFRYGDEIYRAEPSTVFSELIDRKPQSSTTLSGPLFWILLIASILFALFVLIILLCAFNFVRRRSKDTPSIFGGAHNGPFGLVSSYMGGEPNPPTSSSDGISRRSSSTAPAPRTASAEELRAVGRSQRPYVSHSDGSAAEQSRAIGRNGSRVAPYHLNVEPKVVNRRPSQTTLFY